MKALCLQWCTINAIFFFFWSKCFLTIQNLKAYSLWSFTSRNPSPKHQYKEKNVTERFNQSIRILTHWAENNAKQKHNSWIKQHTVRKKILKCFQYSEKIFSTYYMRMKRLNSNLYQQYDSIHTKNITKKKCIFFRSKLAGNIILLYCLSHRS